MQIFKLVLDEFKRILQNKVLMAIFVGIAFGPLLYGVLNLWSMWDIHDKLNKIPVAVVNQDKGFVNEGAAKNVGSDLVKKLKGNTVFDWHFINNIQEAHKGLESDKYYAIIVMPAEFSAKVFSVTAEKPEPAKLEAVANEGKNSTATQIIDRVLVEINGELNSNITKEYLNNIFIKTKKGTEKLSDATKGTKEMLDGGEELVNGSARLTTGLSKINGGLKSLNNGMNDLYSGGGKLTAGLSQTSAGSLKLANGLQAAVEGLEKVDVGMDQAQAGSVTLAEGYTKAIAGSSQLIDGASKVKLGIGGTSTAVGNLKASINGLLANNEIVAAKIEGTLAAINSGDLNSATALLTEAKVRSTTTSGGLSKVVSTGLDPMAVGLNQLETGQVQLITGLNSLKTGLQTGEAGGKKLAAALQELNNGVHKITVGASSAEDGAVRLSKADAQIYAGAQKLYNGLGDASGGVKKLKLGAQEAYYGSQKITGGQSQINDGLNTLHVGLAQAAATKVPNDLAIQVMSKPVKVEEKIINKVPNNGTGLSPYFIAQAIFIGAVMLFFIVQLREDKLTINRYSNLSLVMGKYITLSVVGIFQAIILSVILITFLDLEVARPLEFFALNILLSLCFISVVQFLVNLLGNIGLLTSVGLFVFQISSSAGIYPKETMPSFFQAIGAFLPMTYGIRAFREVISGGSGSSLSANIVVLILFTVVPLLITIFTYKPKALEEYNPVSVN